MYDKLKWFSAENDERETMIPSPLSLIHGGQKQGLAFVKINWLQGCQSQRTEQTTFDCILCKQKQTTLKT